MSRSDRFFIVLLVSLGALLLSVGGWFVWQGYCSLDWIETQGQIVRSITAERTTPSDPETGASALYYRAIIEYTYPLVDRAKDPYARVYFSDRIFWGQPLFSTSKEADLWTSRFREGDRVTVRMHPTRPRLAVLLPGIHWPTALGFLAPSGLFFLFAALFRRKAR